MAATLNASEPLMVDAARPQGVPPMRRGWEPASGGTEAGLSQRNATSSAPLEPADTMARVSACVLTRFGHAVMPLPFLRAAHAGCARQAPVHTHYVRLVPQEEGRDCLGRCRSARIPGTDPMPNATSGLQLMDPAFDPMSPAFDSPHPGCRGPAGQKVLCGAHEQPGACETCEVAAAGR